MSIVRFHPIINDVMKAQQDMNRLFEGFFPRVFEQNDATVWRPVVDLHEDKDNYIIDAELAGMNKEDVKINYEDGTLSISGERSYKHETGKNGNGADKTTHRVERFYGRFSRTITFPTPVNEENIMASFENGVLTVTVPKAETVKPKQIEIK